MALVDNWWPHERKPWDAVLNRQFGKQMEGLATLSELVGDQILATGISKPLWKGFHPIANDLPPLLSQKEARNALNWPQESPIVLFYGLIRPYKGLDLLLKAFAEPALKNTTIKLAVVGESYENFSKYKLLIHKLGLEDSVLLDLNFADSSKTQQVFSACNLVAQTYHTATQSGVTPLAYHFEKPILASDIPGLREPIVKDQTGILIQKTPAAIAEGVLKLLYNQEFKVAQLNLKLQHENYRWAAFAKNLLDFMESSKMS
ncbi:MAG: glycosyltransferase [Flavobacteriaceae bacterium]